MQEAESGTGGAHALQAETRDLWIKAAVVWGLVVAGLLISFRETATAIFGTWWGSATFNHCFLILPIVAYLVWERRVIFTLLRPSPSLLGLAIMLLGGIGWMMGSVGGALVVEEFSLALIIQGSVVAIFGTAVARALIFPLFFMYFAVPFGDFLIPKLQDITAVITVWLIKLSGLPVFSDGVFISVPNGDFHVAEACSGVRFLIASLPLGVLFSNIAFLTWQRRTIVILLSIVIPIIANGMRAYGIIMIAYLTDNEYALGVDHLVYGWIFFAFVTLVFLSIGMLFMDRPNDSPVVNIKKLALQNDAQTSLLSIAIFGLLAVGVANIAPQYAAFLEQKAATRTMAELQIPKTTGPWVASEPEMTPTPWEPRFSGIDHRILQTYVRADGARVTLYIGYFNYQRRNAEIVSYGNTIAAPEPWDWASMGKSAVQIDRSEVTVQAATLVSKFDRRRVWSWYWVDGRFVADPLIAKLLTAKARVLSGPTAAAVIAVSVGGLGLNEHKSLVLQDFLNHLEPLQPVLTGASARH